MDHPLVIGLDFGTDSVRAVLVDTSNGNEISSDTFQYPRWTQGLYCDPSINQFRQHPLDHLEGLSASIQNTLKNAPVGSRDRIRAISIDTTGSTPVAVDRAGTPLALREDFENNPNAMFILWKDHTSTKEASDINETAKNWGGEDFTKYSGGVYSSEWYWAKILRMLRIDEDVRKQAYSWVEHCDWIPAVLTGTENPDLMKRSRCAAGHKALWHESWDGLPPDDFWIAVDPLLAGLRKQLYNETDTADQPAGSLTDSWANQLGLSPGIPVGVGALDAHMGAVGGLIRANSYVKVIGTSTCDILAAPNDEIGLKLVEGICGQVNGSVVPGMIGLEAGQSAFGDIYAWFKDLISWPLKQMLESDQVEGTSFQLLILQTMDKLIPQLNDAAAKIPIGESGIVSVDWMNGRRTPYANQELRGAIMGLNLGSDAPKIFKSLVEATAFGAKKILDRFMEEEVRINEIIAIGGVAKKSPFVMQTIADVFDMDIKVASSEQTVALGAAMFAAVVGGIYDTIDKAQNSMGRGFERTYSPIPENVEKYRELYRSYLEIGDFIENRLN